MRLKPTMGCPQNAHKDVGEPTEWPDTTMTPCHLPDSVCVLTCCVTGVIYLYLDCMYSLALHYLYIAFLMLFLRQDVLYIHPQVQQKLGRSVKHEWNRMRSFLKTFWHWIQMKTVQRPFLKMLYLISYSEFHTSNTFQTSWDRGDKSCGMPKSTWSGRLTCWEWWLNMTGATFKGSVLHKQGKGRFTTVWKLQGK